MIFIKIGWQYFNIKYVDDLVDEMQDSCNGTFNSGRGEILINNILSKAQREETLLHEIYHAINHLMCIDLSETEITALSHGMKMFIDDNWREMLAILEEKRESLDEALGKKK